MPWAAETHQTPEATRELVETFQRDHADPACDMFVVGVFDRATGEVVGGVGPSRFHHATGAAEVGYWLRADRRGRGLATEAAGACISSCLTPAARGGWGLRRIEIRCAEANEASAAVARRLGLRQELRAIDARWVDGIGWCTELGFAVLADAWDADAHRIDLVAR